MDFSEYQTSASYQGTPQIVDYAEEINRILDDNDVSRSDIVSAKLVSASYSVTSFSHTPDDTISGSITIERTDKPDGPVPLLK